MSNSKSRVVVRLITVAAIAGSLVFIPSAPASALSPNEKYVSRVFADFDGRAPTSGELSYYATFLNNGNTRLSFMQFFITTTDFRNRWITGTYQRYLSRNPTSSELSGAFSALQSSANFLATEADVLGASPYFVLNESSNREFVDSLYNDIVFREADNTNWDYYTLQLDNATMTRRQVALALLRGSESISIRVQGLSGPTTCSTITLSYSDDIASGSYCLILDRMADSAGASYWIAAFGPSDAMPNLWTYFGSYTEYFNLAQI